MRHCMQGVQNWLTGEDPSPTALDLKSVPHGPNSFCADSPERISVPMCTMENMGEIAI